MRIGLEIKVNVSKLDKSKLFEGKTGKWLTLKTFINTEEQDQYGNNSFITESPTEEEKIGKVKLPIVGNSKIFWKEQQQQPQNNGFTPRPASQPEPDDDIPF